ncbi:uncharacterized protein [Glycine max]|uniref:uncharacterized protein n=1 Tax=Glycine max TaxID=3847 RepID=UPI001B3568F1|nr:uncharacterized protein LOC121172676 [Glycine max]
MEREEERERRRVRDKQRRQSMNKEQRERHLARRRRNYQLRRQRSANNAPLMAEALSTPSNSSFQILQGSSIPLEAFPRRLRLNAIKRLARNLGTPMTVPPSIANHPVAPDLISLSASSADDGSIITKSKPLRLNCVKRLARSLSFPAEKTAPQNNHNGIIVTMTFSESCYSTPFVSSCVMAIQ